MVETAGSGELVPELPELEGQTAQTAPTITQSVIVVARTPSQYLGQDIAADYSGLVQESGEIRFDRAAVSLINSHLISLKEAKLQAEQACAEERTKNTTLTTRATDAEKQAAVLDTKLTSERQNSSLRLVFNALGGVALGVVPFASDKAGLAGGLLAGAFGIALLIAAWAFRSRVKP
jgi:hypothetical protein